MAEILSNRKSMGGLCLAELRNGDTGAVESSQGEIIRISLERFQDGLPLTREVDTTTFPPEILLSPLEVVDSSPPHVIMTHKLSLSS